MSNRPRIPPAVICEVLQDPGRHGAILANACRKEAAVLIEQLLKDRVETADRHHRQVEKLTKLIVEANA